MDMIDIKFSFSNLIFASFTAIVAVVLFVLIKKYVEKTYFKLSRQKKTYRLWIYAVELILLIVGLIAFVGYLRHDNFIFSVVLLIVVLFCLVWILNFYIKDYITGLLIKLKGEFQEGDRILIQGRNGLIYKLGLTQIKIKIEEEGFLIMNNSQFIQAEKMILESEDLVKSNQLILDITKPYDKKEWEAQLQKHLSNLPWLNMKYAPQIEFETTDADKDRILISLLAYDEKYYPQIEQSLRLLL